VFWSLTRALLFRLEPERAHRLTLSALRTFAPLLPQRRARRESAVTLRGLTFANRVGLAAGFDKDGMAFTALGKLGFGFVEIGTVTPLPQLGNAAPRVFRLPASRALINRMGFPNAGAQVVAERLRAGRRTCVVGVNVGKSAVTPLYNAATDYVAGFNAFKDIADYIVLNVSSPNTSNLRSLQAAEPLAEILGAVQSARTGALPLVLLKLAPDLSDEQLDSAATQCRHFALDGIVATNTTISRDGISNEAAAGETGGLSGAPLLPHALHAVRRLRAALGPDMILIGCGGVMSGADAAAMRDAGADLVQLYTGLVYRGPGLVQEVTNSVADPHR
jgi:dihydroorotate dehydrogenase